jgi:hypothetical protein
MYLIKIVYHDIVRIEMLIVHILKKVIKYYNS